MNYKNCSIINDYDEKYLHKDGFIRYKKFLNNGKILVTDEWTSPGNYQWTSPIGITSVSLCACGGGGSGAYRFDRDCGGGWAGEIYHNENHSIEEDTEYSITIGTGGEINTNESTDGYDGSSTRYPGGSVSGGEGGTQDINISNPNEPGNGYLGNGNSSIVECGPNSGNTIYDGQRDIDDWGTVWFGGEKCLANGTNGRVGYGSSGATYGAGSGSADSNHAGKGGDGYLSITYETTPVPLPITDFNATDNLYDKVTCTWTDNGDVTKINIYRDGTNIATDVISPYNDTTASEGIIYEYYVEACNDGGCIESNIDTGGILISIPFFIGNTKASTIMVGQDEVSCIYIGNNQIYCK